MADNKQNIQRFEEYLRQGEPSRRKKALMRATSIGLQQVDGLQTSPFLPRTALRHIEGEITIEVAKRLIDDYYASKKTVADK